MIVSVSAGCCWLREQLVGVVGVSMGEVCVLAALQMPHLLLLTHFGVDIIVCVDPSRKAPCDSAGLQCGCRLTTVVSP